MKEMILDELMEDMDKEESLKLKPNGAEVSVTGVKNDGVTEDITSGNPMISAKDDEEDVSDEDLKELLKEYMS